jgi:hypothetical protein
MDTGEIYIKKELFSLIALLIIGIFLSCPAMSMSDADKGAIELTTIIALNETGDFNYVNSDVDDENNLTIWYVPKESDENATIKTLGVIIGIYLGAIESNPDISDMYIFMGTEGDEKGSLYCLRSWVPNNGNLADDQIAGLVLKIFGTFEDLS